MFLPGGAHLFLSVGFHGCCWVYVPVWTDSVSTKSLKFELMGENVMRREGLFVDFIRPADGLPT